MSVPTPSTRPEVPISFQGDAALAQKVLGTDILPGRPGHFDDIYKYNELASKRTANTMDPLAAKWFDNEVIYLKKAAELQEDPEFAQAFGSGIEGTYALVEFAKQKHAQLRLDSKVMSILVKDDEKKASSAPFFKAAAKKVT